MRLVLLLGQIFFMKGVVFTEFVEMVEKKFGYEVADKLLSIPDLESKGVFTAIGTYSHYDMFKLVGGLSELTKISVENLFKAYGRTIFVTFTRMFPGFFKEVDDSLIFLEGLESHIHVQVKKLYPDAELPTFETTRLADNKIQMIYSSDRRMGDFALGLMEGCADYFDQSLDIHIQNLKPDGSEVKFDVTRN